jgi:hypothetical protein
VTTEPKGGTADNNATRGRIGLSGEFL